MVSPYVAFGLGVVVGFIVLVLVMIGYAFASTQK